MTEPRRLRAIPDGRDATILDWLGAAEPVDARPVLEAAFARLPGVRQVRPWPWDSIVDVLRPIDRRTRQTRWAILLVAVALLMALLIGTLLPGGYLNVPRPSVLPAPTAPLAVAPSVLVGPSASARAIHPLAVPRLAIASAGKDGRLYVDWSDGTTRVRLGQDITAGLAQPAWSPDGKRILVLAGAADTEQQWEVDPRGADPSQVVLPCTSPCGSRNEASYSRDGTRIVFFEARGDVVAGIPSRCSLMIYDRRSQEVDAVHAFDCGVEEDREPRFSPDGEKVAFWRSRHDLPGPSLAVDEAAIFVRDLRTGKEQQVTDWPIHATSLDWSPDGGWITFTKDWWTYASGYFSDVWRIHPDGTGLQQVTHLRSGGAWQPRYSPDGRWILFAWLLPTGSRLAAVSPDGGQPIEVLPGGEQIYQFDVLPATRLDGTAGRSLSPSSPP